MKGKYPDPLVHPNEMGCGASSTDKSIIAGSASSTASQMDHPNDSDDIGTASNKQAPKLLKKIDYYNNEANQTPVKQPAMISPVRLEKMLKEFEKQNNNIQTMEKTKCFEYYRVVLEELEQLNSKKLRTNQLYSDCLQRIHNFTKENEISKDITLREVVANKWIQKTQLTKDESELIKFLSTREILDISREKIATQIESLTGEAENYKSLCDHLQDYYEKRDDLLNSIFGPTYRSDKELKFDRELEALLEERHFIECAKLRWIKGGQYLRDAMVYIHSAIESLEKYENCLENDIDNRFTSIRESRDDLHNYTFNIKAMKSILLNLKLPHTKSDDITRLCTITSELIIQTFDNDRISETIRFLIDLEHQTSLQNKWIKEVLVGTIQRDLKIIRPKCDDKAQQLFALRVEIIRKMISERQDQSDQRNSDGRADGTMQAKVMNVVPKYFHDSPLEMRADSGVDSELEESILLSEELQTAHRAAANSGTDSELSTTTPLLPGEELGPIPSNNEIFGKIQQLRRQHSQEMDDFEAAQSLNRAKISQALKDKLTDRRSRRYRMEMHRRQLEALQELPQS